MIDSHCHIDFEAFDKNRDEVIADAAKAGVHTLINIGADLLSSQRSAELAKTHDNIFAAVGVHPHDARSADQACLDQIRRLAGGTRVVAIGEIGLDYYRDLSPREVQRQAFDQQLQLAVQLKLPIVIHTREAFEETFEIVKQYAFDLPGGVFHCFPGNTSEAERVIELGFVLGIGGVVTYKNSSMATVAAQVPLDKIILETDAPYLTPVPHRGKTNYPAYVRLVCDKVAELRGISAAEVEKITDRTVQKLLGLVEVFGD
jgi:TatD DNase family protein